MALQRWSGISHYSCQSSVCTSSLCEEMCDQPDFMLQADWLKLEQRTAEVKKFSFLVDQFYSLLNNRHRATKKTPTTSGMFVYIEHIYVCWLKKNMTVRLLTLMYDGNSGWAYYRTWLTLSWELQKHLVGAAQLCYRMMPLLPHKQSSTKCRKCH